ncbi:hypothetical protein Syun_006286 [Stephania yunnanensis]|uniref:Uncharacterized protein n=1 Tax=Stephania yunnanensis TaxID=152371 RepID=A0AAP0KYY0_9MAGN
MICTLVPLPKCMCTAHLPIFVRLTQAIYLVTIPILLVHPSDSRSRPCDLNLDSRSRSDADYV